MYLSLYNQYKSSLTCPCTQIAIPYKKFLTVNPSYHQYCSSYYNSKAWLDIVQSIDLYLERTGNPTVASPTSIFIALSDFCRFSGETVNDSLASFYQSSLISGYTIQPDIFESQAEAIVNLFISSTSNSFKRSAALIRRILANDQVLRGAHGTNFYATVDTTRQTSDTGVKFGFRTITTANNTPCYCYIDSSCADVAYIQSFNPNSPSLPVPGVYVGCSIIESLYISTLQVFYDSAFIASLNIPSNVPVVPLNRTVPSRYNTTTPFGTIIEQLFVEDWNTTYAFEDYYIGCQPSSCSYIVQIRRETIEILTAVLGIIGRVTSVVGTVVPFVIERIVDLFGSEEKDTVDNQNGNSAHKYEQSQHDNDRDLTDIHA
ncbi:unnamed protein product [Adineta ricciae]|uniref:Uncharacterized protein n=1 Tax=Adineta ricciae TaxID=249248 RepID=A0A814S812_ADIRI|nr:unnamed protein product [Adineta ricciae]